jgi:hypothetical protein
MTLSIERPVFFGRLARAACAAALIAAPGMAGAAVLDNEARRTLTLSDGLQVNLIGTVQRGTSPREYYALPTQLLNARNSAGEPQFLFMAFTTNDRPEDGGAAGGLLHALVEWGLTPEQEAELAARIEALEPGAEYKGFVQLLPPDGEKASFALVSAVLSDDGFTSSVVDSGEAPMVAGGRAAFAARLDPLGAQALYKTFEGDTAVGDLSVTMNFSYATQVQGAKGFVSIDWSKIEQESERLEAEYKETYGWAEDRDRCWFFWRCDAATVSYSYDEVRSQYEFLAENELIKFEFEEGFPDERVAPIREAFIQYFINTMSEPTPPPARTGEDEEAADAEMPDIRQGQQYTYTQERTRSSIERTSRRFSMDYKFQVKWPHQITGNVKDWQSFARDFEGAYQKVILDDPFFDWRDVLFVVDLDSQELFEEQVNFVTVNVEKQREDGVWQDSVTLDKQYIAENGVRAAMTYSRGDDSNSDLYRYQYQWAFRGGLRYPEQPQWQQGSWEGVTLAAPIRARTIEFEADLDELSDAGITRATAQVRYPRLGREEEENIHLSVAGEQPLKEAQVFMDNDARGYVYRLILNHRRFGRMATPWSARVSDDYIFAIIPDELLEADSEDEPAVVEAQAAADAPQNDVLAEFDVLIGGVN